MLPWFSKAWVYSKLNAFFVWFDLKWHNTTAERKAYPHLPYYPSALNHALTIYSLVTHFSNKDYTINIFINWWTKNSPLGRERDLSGNASQTNPGSLWAPLGHSVTSDCTDLWPHFPNGPYLEGFTCLSAAPRKSMFLCQLMVELLYLEWRCIFHDLCGQTIHNSTIIIKSINNICHVSTRYSKATNQFITLK